jgi:subtilisin family serine protease
MVEDVFPKQEADPTVCPAERITGEFLVSWKSGAISLERAPSREALIKEIIEPNLEQIDHAEYNYRLTVEFEERGARSTWDPYPNWGVDAIEAEVAWQQGIEGASASGEPVLVAVIDTGVNIEHVELEESIFINQAEYASGKNGVDEDNNGYVDDFYGWNFYSDTPISVDEIGHGTHVAGTIAASHEVGYVLGVAPKAKILPLDFMEGHDGSTFDAIRAIKYARQMGAKIINASWGGGQCSNALKSEIIAAGEAGILFVAAAGNYGDNISKTPTYPAAFFLPSQITVGASTPDFRRANFSNYGNLVHLLGPGLDILSTYSEPSNESVRFLSGTSMATPHVAGVAALLWSKAPEASVHQIREALLRGVKPGAFFVANKGEISVPGALQALEEILSE